MPLKQDVEHEAVLVHRPPQPVSDAIDARTHLVQMPPGTPAGFLVAKLFGEEGRELDTPFAQRLVTDLDAALVNKSFQTLGNTVQDRNGTKLDLKNCGQYGLLQQCLSFALPRSTWPF